MGHHKSRKLFRKICAWDILVLGIGSVGIGMIIAIFIPFWVWIIIVGISLIAYAVWYYNSK